MSNETEFNFGDTLLLDGVTACKYIHPDGVGYHTIDINGMWLSVHPDRLTLKTNYL